MPITKSNHINCIRKWPSGTSYIFIGPASQPLFLPSRFLLKLLKSLEAGPLAFNGIHAKHFANSCNCHFGSVGAGCEGCCKMKLILRLQLAQNTHATCWPRCWQ